MTRFSINKRFDINPPLTSRVRTVLRMFGLTIDRLKDNAAIHKADVEVNAGDVVYITGPSGAGKSVLLRELQNAIPADEKISIDEIALPADRAAIDCIGEEFRIENEELRIPKTARRCASFLNSKFSIHNSMTTIEALRLLSYAGLSDVFAILTPPANLSEGQKYRFRFACCLASGKKTVFADEFCANLDRITAAVIAYNVRKFAKRTGTTFILASSHEDILADLQPDVLVVKRFTGPAEVVYKKLKS